MAPPVLSRRKILAGLGGIGVAGAVSGAGTHALLTGGETLSGSIQSGTLSIDVSCQRCHVGGDGVSFAFDGIDRGDGGRETLDVAIETNPASLWLRSDCPPTADRLGDALAVTLRYDGVAVESGTLSAVRRSLRTGVRLGEECTTPDVTSELDLEWELPLETPDSVAGESTGVTLELFAEQCRHIESGGGENPFAGTTPCEESDDDCLPCPRTNGERIASAAFEYDGPDEAFVELIRAGRGARSGDVLSGRTVDPGETFAAVLHDPPAIKGGPDIDVVVDGTAIGDFHISCSQPFGPGLVVSDGTSTLTVLEAVDTAGNGLCEVSEQ